MDKISKQLADGAPVGRGERLLDARSIAYAVDLLEGVISGAKPAGLKEALKIFESAAGPKLAAAFAAVLPGIQKMYKEDLQAAYEGDPAAQSVREVITCYPGVRALLMQRMAHWFYGKKVKILPRVISEYAHSLTGIDIHPGAKIGHGCFIDHGTGVVIGETCEIGPRVKIYQGVTLGAKSFALDKKGRPVKGGKRHPTVQDGATIYANATILGPVTIGKNSVVGGNTWITVDVAAGAVVTLKKRKV